ncbi:MAG: pyridoxamine 5'-phosphate oxidase family protein, partial [Candidatus Limnocylindrales bacterium]
MPTPIVPESHRDLLDSRFATLATVGPDGRPQVSEVWFLAEDDAVRVSLNVTRQKT